MLTCAVATALAACGGGSDDSDATGLPECAGAGAAIARPASIPPGFPLPPGTVFTGERQASERAVVLSGFIPDDLETATAFLRRELVKSGYEAGAGDAEPGIEAEALFHSRRLDGAWKVNAIRACGDAVRLTLALIRKRG